MNQIGGNGHRNAKQTTEVRWRTDRRASSDYRRSITTRSQLSFTAILIAKCLKARMRLSFGSMSSKRKVRARKAMDGVLLGFSVAVFNFIFFFCSIKLALNKNWTIRSVPATSSKKTNKALLSFSLSLRWSLPRFSAVKNVSNKVGFRRYSNQLAVWEVTEEVNSFIRGLICNIHSFIQVRVKKERGREGKK